MGGYLMKYLTILLICICLAIGCAPKQFNPTKPDTVTFEKNDPYVLDLSNTVKPEKMKSIFVNSNFEEVPPENAKYVLLTPEEYSKIPALLRLCKEYKDIAEKQAELVNNEVSKGNDLKEYLVLEQKKRDCYFELWVLSENAYRQERYYHDMDKFYNYVLIVGVVVLAALL
jgi:hypothetical protein